MDTDPIPRSHRDRRTTPRRAEDVALHYARENLLAAADAMVGPTLAPSNQTIVSVGFFGAGPEVITNMAERYDALRSAVEQYRTADAAAHSD